MNSVGRRNHRAFTFIALLVIVALLAILAALLLPALAKAKQKAQRINCVNNLKQDGLAFRIWAGDHDDVYPMGVAAEKGGTAEFTTGADTFRHFQVMANELSTPQILACPADVDRTAAYNFTKLTNKNVSYFVGLEANETNPQLFLAGDRNLNGTDWPHNGILKLSPGDPVTWTSTIHGNQGNTAFSDGSVQQLSNAGLGRALKNTGDATNVWRLSLPE